jgi:hypothetical protein
LLSGHGIVLQPIFSCADIVSFLFPLRMDLYSQKEVDFRFCRVFEG